MRRVDASVDLTKRATGPTNESTYDSSAMIVPFMLPALTAVSQGYAETSAYLRVGPTRWFPHQRAAVHRGRRHLIAELQMETVSLWLIQREL